MKPMSARKFLWFGLLWLLGTGYLLSAIYYAGATHRSGPAIGPFGSRDTSCELEEVGMHDQQVVNGSEEGAVSPYLLEGTWEFIADGLNPFTGQVTFGAATDTGLDTAGKIKDIKAIVGIQPGQNLLTFEMSDKRGSCHVTYEVTGISVGEPFEIRGPCVAEVNKDIGYTAVLRGDNSPFGVITNSSAASELIVTMGGNPHEVEIQGEYVSDGHKVGIEDGGEITVKFLATGTYEMKLIWNTMSPPIGASAVKVSEATYKWDVVVVAAGTTNRCSGVTIDDAWALGLTGTVRCDGGNPVAEINEENIKQDIQNLAAQLGISLTSQQLSDLTDIYKDCTEQYEGSHVDFYNDPNFTPFVVCEGCGNCNVAQVFDESNTDECGVHHGGEAIGYDESSNCFDASNVFATTDTNMDTILINLRDKHRQISDAHLDCLLGCPHSPPCSNPNL